MGEIFLLCHLLIHTCLCDTGFSAKVLRVSWNCRHATVLLNNGLESKRHLSWEFQEKGGKEERSFYAGAVCSFFFWAAAKALVFFSKNLLLYSVTFCLFPKGEELKMWKAQLLSNSFLEHLWEINLSSMSFLTRWAVTASEKVTKEFPV